MSERILSVLVEDKPGVLARVSSTISRRGFNINSLSVGPTNIEGRSKMTIVTELDAVAVSYTHLTLPTILLV